MKKISIWTNSTTLGNSTLFQTGGNVSVGSILQLPATGTATASKGFNSQPLDLAASAFNSSIATVVPQHFRWQTEPVGNNTAAPSGKLNLLFAPGVAVPAETGVSLSNSGPTNLLRRTKAPRGRECTPTSIAKKAIRTMQPTGTGRAEKPVCQEPLDTEWLTIVRDLLG